MMLHVLTAIEYQQAWFTILLSLDNNYLIPSRLVMANNSNKSVIDNRHSFSPKEIDEALSKLEQAIENHRVWYCQLHEGLLCNQPLNENITSPIAHTKCNFGCWYYENASEAIHASPDFRKIETVHKIMHDKARELVEKFYNSNQINLAEYRSLSDAQKHLILLLVSLRDSIVSQQHSFDPLTGLINRKLMNFILEKNHAHSIRHIKPYIVAMLDIDYFKSINDNYGHFAGDKALQAVSTYLSASFRDSDSASRYGGEEFLILMPGATHDVSSKVLERVRHDISQLSIQYDDAEIKLTVSIGFSGFEPGKSVWEIVKNADTALYNAKANGRNQVIAYDDSMELGS